MANASETLSSKSAVSSDVVSEHDEVNDAEIIAVTAGEDRGADDAVRLVLRIKATPEMTAASRVAGCRRGTSGAAGAI